SDDLHSTVINRVPGVILVANYIESILYPARCFRPAGKAADIGFGLVIYAVFVWLVVSNWKWWQKAGGMAALFLGATFILTTLFASWNIIVDPAALSLLAMATKVVSPYFEELVRKA